MAVFELFSMKNVNGFGKKYTSHLDSYTSACKADPELKAFDSKLHERTEKITSSIFDQTKIQSLSQSSSVEVYEFLRQQSQNAVNFIIDSREDVRKSEDLRSLVKTYFESTAKTLDFCNTFQNCVKKTEISQCIIKLTVKHFETESVNTEVGKKKYEKTLGELNKFKAAGNPFDVEFLTLYESVFKEQVSLMEKLHKLRVKLYKKLRKVKILRIISNVFFVTAYVSALVLSVVAVAMLAPPLAPVVGAVAAVVAEPIAYAGIWCNKMLKGYEEALKRQGDLVFSVEERARVNNEVMINIKANVDNLVNKISKIQGNVDFVEERDGDEEAIKIGLQQIMEKVDDFTKKINEVGVSAAECSDFVLLGRHQVLKHILNLPAT